MGNLLSMLSFRALLLVLSVATAVSAGAHAPKVTLLGDASVKNGSISLTCGGHSCLGVGRALHSHPVRLRQPCTNRTLSFSSNFTFSITPINGTFGDGLAFLITSDGSHLGSSHGYMGIFNIEHDDINSNVHAHLSRQKNNGGSGIATMAVEFDTSLNNGDINGNHVALDLGNMSSVLSADAASAGVGLKSGNKMRAWVEYDGDGEQLRVWLSYSQARPAVPLINTKVDLSGLLHDNMFVGFSASNGRGAAMHVVEEWRFQTSPIAVKASTSTSTSMSTRTRLALGLGLGIGLASVLALVVTGCMLYRRLHNLRREEPEKSVDNLV